MSESTKDLEAKAAEDSHRAEEELLAFFHALPADARAEYRALAERDLRFGEDVRAEVGSTS